VNFKVILRRQHKIPIHPELRKALGATKSPVMHSQNPIYVGHLMASAIE